MYLPDTTSTISNVQDLVLNICFHIFSYPTVACRFWVDHLRLNYFACLGVVQSFDLVRFLSLQPFLLVGGLVAINFIFPEILGI